MSTRSEFPGLNAAMLAGAGVLAPGAKLFKVEKLSTVFASSFQEGNKSMASYGPMKLPYDDCWFEFETHNPELVHLQNAPVGEIDRDMVTPGANLALVEGRIIATVVAKTQIGVRSEESISTLIDGDGNFVAFEAPAHGRNSHNMPAQINYISFDAVCVPGVSDGPMNFQSNLGPDVVRRALFVVGLTNCRNIGTEVKTTRPRGGKKSRRVRPGIEYRVISIPSELRAALSAASTAAASALRLHTVRGHFKTFTSDRPLMGKLTGTYWWGWQARGNKDNGEVISTYNLGGESK